MIKEKYYPPVYKTMQFHCPQCNVYAHQSWANITAQNHNNGSLFNLSDFHEYLDVDWMISKCGHCKKLSIWYKQEIIYPKKIVVENPNEDMEESIKNDYLEAAKIFNDSPRASAALLRVALQKLCKQLGEKGDNINHDIGELVKKGLDKTLQEALDSLRIIGNNGTHPGEINLQ